MLGIRIPHADEAMIISGGRGGTDGTPFRVVIGSRAFVMPFLRNAAFLTLRMQEATVQETCQTIQGITVNLSAVGAFKVGDDTQSIVSAGQRFLSDQNQMSTLVGQIFAGHLRGIVGAMTVEEIIRERQKLANEVLDASKDELAHIGLVVDSFQIQSINDGGSGYIDALAAPHNAEIQKQAAVAQAQADQAAAEAKQKSVQAQAMYSQQTAEVEAGAQAKINIAKANAEAETVAAQQESERRQAEARKSAIEAQAELAEEQAMLTAKQLENSQVRPAEAQAKIVRLQAEAEAAAMKIRAAAASENDRVALDLKWLEIMPDIMDKIADAFADSNITVLNGADGLGEVMSGMVAQAMTVFNAAKAMTAESGIAEAGTVDAAPSRPLQTGQLDGGQSQPPTAPVQG
jgi:flotillin